MKMARRRKLYEGKAKRVYATDREDVVAVEYKDDATAFNALKKAQLAGKGPLNCRISALLFEYLMQRGIHALAIVAYTPEEFNESSI